MKDSMSSNEAQLHARARWEIAYERMSLELEPPGSGFWEERPRDLKAAVQLARAALDEIEAAYGRGES